MTPALELRGLSKRFGGLTATDDVSVNPSVLIVGVNTVVGVTMVPPCPSD